MSRTAPSSVEERKGSGVLSGMKLRWPAMRQGSGLAWRSAATGWTSGSRSSADPRSHCLTSTHLR